MKTIMVTLMNAFHIDFQSSYISNNYNNLAYKHQLRLLIKMKNTKIKTLFVHLDTFRSLVEPHSPYFSLCPTSSCRVLYP